MNQLLYAPCHERVNKYDQPNGMSFLRKQAENIASKSEDYSLDPSKLNFRVADDGRLVAACNGKQFWVSDYALRQLCARLDVPAKYIIRCFASGEKDLAKQNLQAWYKAKDGEYRVRVTDGRIRGIVTQRFSLMDSHEILAVMADVIKDDYRLTNYLLNDSRLHARFVMPGTIRIPGEDLEVGIQVDSSDVGRQTLQVRYFLFKQICSNGLIATRFGGDLFRHRHVGIDRDHFRAELNNGLQRIPQINRKVVASIKQAIDTAYIVDDFERALRYDPMIRKFKKEAEVTNEFLRNVVTRQRANYQENLWGFVNAITDVCQNQDVEDRLLTERFAANVLFPEN